MAERSSRIALSRPPQPRGAQVRDFLPLHKGDMATRHRGLADREHADTFAKIPTTTLRLVCGSLRFVRTAAQARQVSTMLVRATGTRAQLARSLQRSGRVGAWHRDGQCAHC
jgi:hypothetical protein